MTTLANLVRVVSTTTGTGTLTLSVAVQGFLTPTQAGLTDNQVVSYAIEADYVSNVATSREQGYGTLGSSATTLTRIVVNSTNTNALLNLAGDEQIIITPKADDSRTLLIADTSYYVRTDGSDSNNGLANTAAGAWLTLQHAYDAIAGTLDFGGHTVTINIGAGTFTTGVSISNGWVGGNLSFAGAGATTIISTGGNTGFSTSGLLGGTLTFATLKMQGSGNGFFLTAIGNHTITTVDFAHTGYNIRAEGSGVNVLVTGNYTISAAAIIHYYVNNGSKLQTNGQTVTITGTPAWASAFAQGRGQGIMYLAGMTFSGSATGLRYFLELLMSVDTNGGGASYLPGDVNGSALTGSQYA